MWKCLAYSRRVMMSIHLTLKKVTSGPQGMEGATTDGYRSEGHSGKTARGWACFLLVPPPQKAMSFLVRFWVCLVPAGLPKLACCSEVGESNCWLLGEPLHSIVPLLPQRLSAGSALKPFYFGWPWGFLHDPAKAFFFPAPLCFLIFSALPLEIGPNASQLPSHEVVIFMMLMGLKWPVVCSFL